MARARKGTEEVWYDTFSEWSEIDRAAAIKVLDQVHRQLCRIEKRGARAESVQPFLAEEPNDGRDGRDDLDDRDPMQIAAERTPPRE